MGKDQQFGKGTHLQTGLLLIVFSVSQRSNFKSGLVLLQVACFKMLNYFEKKTGTFCFFFPCYS